MSDELKVLISLMGIIFIMMVFLVVIALEDLAKINGI